MEKETKFIFSEVSNYNTICYGYSEFYQTAILFCDYRRFKLRCRLTLKESGPNIWAIFQDLFKVAQNSFQHLYWMGRYNHSLALDAIIMVSKNFSSTGEHVAIIFLTQ